MNIFCDTNIVMEFLEQRQYAAQIRKILTHSARCVTLDIRALKDEKKGVVRGNQYANCKKCNKIDGGLKNYSYLCAQKDAKSDLSAVGTEIVARI